MLDICELVGMDNGCGGGWTCGCTAWFNCSDVVGCFIDRSVGEALLNELADDVLVKKFWYCGVARALNTGELISWRYIGVVFMLVFPFVKFVLNK